MRAFILYGICIEHFAHRAMVQREAYHLKRTPIMFGGGKSIRNLLYWTIRQIQNGFEFIRATII